jgi:Fe2+ transport system protein FeoA
MNWLQWFSSSAEGEIRCPRPYCPLNRVRAGTAVRIKALCAEPETASRLREIGFCEEQMIRLLSNHASLVCKVCNARLAISARLAESILVEPLEPATAS